MIAASGARTSKAHHQTARPRRTGRRPRRFERRRRRAAARHADAAPATAPRAVQAHHAHGDGAQSRRGASALAPSPTSRPLSDTVARRFVLADARLAAGALVRVDVQARAAPNARVRVREARQVHAAARRDGRRRPADRPVEPAERGAGRGLVAVGRTLGESDRQPRARGDARGQASARLLQHQGLGEEGRQGDCERGEGRRRWRCADPGRRQGASAARASRPAAVDSGRPRSGSGTGESLSLSPRRRRARLNNLGAALPVRRGQCRPASRITTGLDAGGAQHHRGRVSGECCAPSRRRDCSPGASICRRRASSSDRARRTKATLSRRRTSNRWPDGPDAPARRPREAWARRSSWLRTMPTAGSRTRCAPHPLSRAPLSRARCRDSSDVLSSCSGRRRRCSPLSDRRARHRGRRRLRRERHATRSRACCSKRAPRVSPARKTRPSPLCGAPCTPTSCERPTRTRSRRSSARRTPRSTSSSASSSCARSRTRRPPARGRRRGRGLAAVGSAAAHRARSRRVPRVLVAVGRAGRPPRPRARERRARTRERPPPALPALAARRVAELRPRSVGPVFRGVPAPRVEQKGGGRRGRDQRALPQPAPREAPGARRDGRGRIDPRALLERARPPRAAPQSLLRRRARLRPRGDGEH